MYDSLGGFWEKGFKGIRPYILGKSMEEIVVKNVPDVKGERWLKIINSVLLV